MTSSRFFLTLFRLLLKLGTGIILISGIYIILPDTLPVKPKAEAASPSLEFRIGFTNGVRYGLLAQVMYAEKNDIPTITSNAVRLYYETKVVMPAIIEQERLKEETNKRRKDGTLQ